MRGLHLDGFLRYELGDALLFLKEPVPQFSVAQDPGPAGCLIRLPAPQFALIRQTSKNRYLLALCDGERADIFRAVSAAVAAARAAAFFAHEDPAPHS